MNSPNKDLLSAVLGKNVKMVINDIKVIHGQLNSSVKKSEIAILYDDEWHYENIYELMHLMKEWIWNEGYSIGMDMLGLKSFNVYLHSLETENKVYNKDEYQVEDFEAVIKACEWILEQHK